MGLGCVDVGLEVVAFLGLKLSGCTESPGITQPLPALSRTVDPGKLEI